MLPEPADFKRLLAFKASIAAVTASLWLAFSAEVRHMNAQTDPDDPEFGVNTMVDAVAWSPDGSMIALASGDYWESAQVENLQVRVVNVATQQVVLTAPQDGRAKLAWSPSGTDLFIGSGSGAIQRYHVPTGSLQAALDSRDLRIWSGRESMSLSPDGSRIAAIFQRTVGNVEFAIYDSQSLQPVLSVDLPFTSQDKNTLTWVGYSPDGSLLATTGWDGMVRLWNANTLAQVAALSTSPGKRLYAGDWSADGRLAVGGWDRYLTVWNVSTHQIITRIEVGSAGSDLRWHPDGRQIATSGGRVWDTVTGQRVQTSSPVGGYWGLDWSPSGVLVYGKEMEGRLILQPNENPLGSLASLTTVQSLPTPRL
jgi:WD40 repeat protein